MKKKILIKNYFFVQICRDAKTELKEETQIQEYQKLLVPKIKDTLNFIRNEFLEVPFIAFYRKEYIQPELDINDLWRIYDLDERVNLLKKIIDY